MALYDSIGRGYAAYRKPDPRIAAALEAALGDARSVINVGAGAGSYEPPGRTAVAIEPSALMIAQRPTGAAPCLQGRAEALPVATAAADAAMAILSIHHWSDPERGLRELRRAARRRVVLLTWVPDAAPFWLTDDYFPEIAAHDRAVFPTAGDLRVRLEAIFASVTMTPLAIPHDCTDGFLCAYWRRPEAYLDPGARGAISSFARFDAGPGLARLRADLAGGRWGARHGGVLSLDAIDAGYRIVTCEVAALRC